MKNLLNTTNKSPEGLTASEKAEMIATDLKFKMRNRISREYHRILY